MWQKFNLSDSLKTVTVLCCIAAALILRLLSLLTGATLWEWLYALPVLLGAGMLLVHRLHTKKQDGERPVTNNIPQKRLALFSLGAAIGCFLHFITQSVWFCRVITGSRAEVYYLVAIATSAVLSLLSSAYFLIVRVSFVPGGYNYRELQIFPVVPLFWCLSEVFAAITGAAEFDRDIPSLLRYATVICMTLYFFFFAATLEKKVRQQRSAGVMSVLYAYFAVLFFIERFMLLMSGGCVIADPDNFLALTLVLLGGFAYAYEKGAVFQE